MAEGGFSTEGQTPNPEQEVRYERRVLGESGDMITFNGKDILDTREGINILMGSDNPVDADKSKNYRLHYEKRRLGGEKEPGWCLIDPEDKVMLLYLEDGKPLPVGRDNKLLFAPEDAKGISRTQVSRKHLAIFPNGENVTIMQRSHTSKSFIDAPQTTIRDTDLMSQSGTSR